MKKYRYMYEKSSIFTCIFYLIIVVLINIFFYKIACIVKSSNPILIAISLSIILVPNIIYVFISLLVSRVKIDNAKEIYDVEVVDAYKTRGIYEAIYVNIHGKEYRCKPLNFYYGNDSIREMNKRKIKGIIDGDKVILIKQ